MKSRFKLFDVSAEPVRDGNQWHWVPRVEIVVRPPMELNFNFVFRMETDRKCETRSKALNLARCWATTAFGKAILAALDTGADTSINTDN